MRTSPIFEENGGAIRKGGEATPRGDRGCELKHWRREKRGQGRHLMSTNIRDELVTLLRDYQDIFTWSY